MHHVFEIEFDERLRNVMFFLKYYTYKMKEGARKPTTKMIELHERLQSVVGQQEPERSMSQPDDEQNIS